MGVGGQQGRALAPAVPGRRVSRSTTREDVCGEPTPPDTQVIISPDRSSTDEGCAASTFRSCAACFNTATPTQVAEIIAAGPDAHAELIDLVRNPVNKNVVREAGAIPVLVQMLPQAWSRRRSTHSRPGGSPRAR